ncbi:hypothetical protein DCO57_12895 [Labrenzia sp. 011]|nr:hypothetical protein DCO57_12895 [Labrenzia sp. 011]
MGDRGGSRLKTGVSIRPGRPGAFQRLLGSGQSDEGQDNADDDHETDEINDVVHFALLVLK